MGKCYTIDKSGVVREGIALKDGFIVLGEEGRGRRLTKVRVPASAVVSNDVLTETPGRKTVVLIRNHSGFRGSWKLHGMDQPNIKVMAEGWCAQGAAGRMGGGPEYLLSVDGSASMAIERSGRLYGHPSLLQVEITEGTVKVIDPNSLPKEWEE